MGKSGRFRKNTTEKEMKVYIVLGVLLNYICIAQSVNRPGLCKKGSGCATNTGTCISVENKIPDLEDAVQCVLDPICTGNKPGACPTFSSWPRAYRDVQALCAFFEPKNCKTGDETSEEAESKVDCFNQTLTFNNETKSKLGIYGCIDKDLYEKQNLGMFTNFTKTQFEACKGNGTDSLLCNGQGTCGAESSLSKDFKCYCNAGYSSEDNCFKASSNECNNAGQCGEAGQCDVLKLTCKCDDGVEGNQCSQCKGTNSCGGVEAGTCKDDKCICNDGFEGDFCKKVVPKSNAMRVLLSSVFSLSILAACIL